MNATPRILLRSALLSAALLGGTASADLAPIPRPHGDVPPGPPPITTTFPADSAPVPTRADLFRLGQFLLEHNLVGDESLRAALLQACNELRAPSLDTPLSPEEIFLMERHLALALENARKCLERLGGQQAVPPAGSTTPVKTCPRGDGNGNKSFRAARPEDSTLLPRNRPSCPRAHSGHSPAGRRARRAEPFSPASPPRPIQRILPLPPDCLPLFRLPTIFDSAFFSPGQA